MANSKIKGITIEIGGNTTKLDKTLKSVNSLLKLDPKNVELLRQKQELLTKSIVETEAKQKMLQETLKKIDSVKVNVNDKIIVNSNYYDLSTNSA